jgi:hypothetical protein
MTGNVTAYDANTAPRVKIKARWTANTNEIGSATLSIANFPAGTTERATGNLLCFGQLDATSAFAVYTTTSATGNGLNETLVRSLFGDRDTSRRFRFHVGRLRRPADAAGVRGRMDSLRREEGKCHLASHQPVAGYACD